MMQKIALYKLILSAILLAAFTPIELWSFSISGISVGGKKQTGNDEEWPNVSWSPGSGNAEPLFWDNTSHISYVIGALNVGQSQPNLDAVRTAIQNSIVTWDNVHTSLSLTYAGEQSGRTGDYDGFNTIFFGYISELGNSAGVTLNKIAGQSSPDWGEIVESDVYLNNTVPWSTSQHICSISSANDVQSIVTHELGHTLGINHSGDSVSNCSLAPTMQPGSNCNSCAENPTLELRSLATDDYEAYHEIYGNGNSVLGTVKSFEGNGSTVGPFVSSKNVTSAQSPTLDNDLSVFPNPFNSETTVTFNVDQAADVSIAIYDEMGQLVHKLVTQQHFGVGKYSVVWKTGADVGVASGIYFISLKIGQAQKTKKITLIR